MPIESRPPPLYGLEPVTPSCASGPGAASRILGWTRTPSRVEAFVGRDHAGDGPGNGVEVVHPSLLPAPHPLDDGRELAGVAPGQPDDERHGVTTDQACTVRALHPAPS